MSDNGLAAFPARLVLLRESLGYDQAVFAKILGFSARAYRAYEAGRRRGCGALKLTLVAARATGVSMDWLLTGRRGPNLPRNDMLPMFTPRRLAA